MHTICMYHYKSRASSHIMTLQLQYLLIEIFVKYNLIINLQAKSCFHRQKRYQITEH